MKEVFIMEDLKVVIGSDHGGFHYKEKVIDYLTSRNIPFVDVGTIPEKMRLSGYCKSCL